MQTANHQTRLHDFFKDHANAMLNILQPRNLPFVDATAVQVDSFRRLYDVPKQPCMITGVMDNWPGLQKWTFEGLEGNGYGDVEVTCGVDSKGQPLRAPCRDFIAYMKEQQDVNPLYVFDQSLSKHGHVFQVCSFAFDLKIFLLKKHKKKFLICF
jgi:hypothetical protein